MTSVDAIKFNNELGRLMRATRVKHGMSLKDVAKRIEITVQQLQKHETGQNNISSYRLFQLSRIFETSFASYIDTQPQQSDYRILDQKRIQSLLEASQAALINLKIELIQN